MGVISQSVWTFMTLKMHCQISFSEAVLPVLDKHFWKLHTHTHTHSHSYTHYTYSYTCKCTYICILVKAVCVRVCIYIYIKAESEQVSLLFRKCWYLWHDDDQDLHRFCVISSWSSVLQTFLVDCPNRLCTGYSRFSVSSNPNSEPLFS